MADNGSHRLDLIMMAGNGGHRFKWIMETENSCHLYQWIMMADNGSHQVSFTVFNFFEVKHLLSKITWWISRCVWLVKNVVEWWDYISTALQSTGHWFLIQQWRIYSGENCVSYDLISPLYVFVIWIRVSPELTSRKCHAGRRQVITLPHTC